MLPYYPYLCYTLSRLLSTNPLIKWSIILKKRKISNSFWPSDVIYGVIIGHTLVLDQMMACRLSAPNHYVNQCRLCQLDPQEQTSVKLAPKCNVYCQKCVWKCLWKMSAKFFRLQNHNTDDVMRDPKPLESATRLLFNSLFRLTTKLHQSSALEALCGGWMTTRTPPPPRERPLLILQ